ncbi:hypothetical protein ANTPLA_LOCUS2490 [Anthophora plagiata]
MFMNESFTETFKCDFSRLQLEVLKRSTSLYSFDRGDILFSSSVSIGYKFIFSLSVITEACKLILFDSDSIFSFSMDISCVSVVKYDSLSLIAGTLFVSAVSLEKNLLSVTVFSSIIVRLIRIIFLPFIRLLFGSKRLGEVLVDDCLENGLVLLIKTGETVSSTATQVFTSELSSISIVFLVSYIFKISF